MSRIKNLSQMLLRMVLHRPRLFTKMSRRLQRMGMNHYDHRPTLWEKGSGWDIMIYQ